VTQSAKARFHLGWHPVRGAAHAWLQPDGGWGLSNAGLIVGVGASMLVDTLYDLARTRAMLSDLAPLTGPASIGTVVNTHGNGDHWFGNQLVGDAEIIAASGTVADMRAVGPAELLGLLSMPGPAGDFARKVFGQYRFDDITPTYPTRTFDDELELEVGGVPVRLLDVGPAHTSADTIVHCPDDGVVYTGDIVFAGGTPIVWAGPVQNWIRALDRIRALGADRLVPGHGPVSGVEVLTAMSDYLSFVQEAATSRHERGMPLDVAVADIDLGSFAGLPESERLAANVREIYHELDPHAGHSPRGPEMFEAMADYDGAMVGHQVDSTPERGTKGPR
jgi:cyclase